ncbi:MAG: flagellar hook-associated protein FlgL [Christensenellales bacterium]|jgi:flagellar hook-associated protein 3 FlgL
MRITNNMMLKNYLSNLNSNLTTLTDYQYKVASGKNINKLSDDPIALISIMNSNVKLQKNAEYTDTVETAIAWLNQTDTSVYQMNEVIQSAYETLVKAVNDSMAPEDKASSAAYIAQLRDQAVTIANGQSGTKFLFGGYNVNNKPFVVDENGKLLYNGYDLTDDTNPDLLAAEGEAITYELGSGISMEISVTGVELMGKGEDNIYNVLDKLYHALMNDAPADELGTYITKLQNCQHDVLTTDAKVGGMINRLTLLKNRYEEEDLTYREMKSNVEDVDLADAYTNYVMSMTVYNAALKVGTQIIQASILDYLR